MQTCPMGAMRYKGQYKYVTGSCRDPLISYAAWRVVPWHMGLEDNSVIMSYHEAMQDLVRFLSLSYFPHVGNPLLTCRGKPCPLSTGIPLLLVNGNLCSHNRDFLSQHLHGRGLVQSTEILSATHRGIPRGWSPRISWLMLAEVSLQN